MYLLDNGTQFKQVKMHPNSQQRKTPTKQKDKLLRGENIVDDVIDKGLISNIYKRLIQFNIKENK